MSQVPFREPTCSPKGNPVVSLKKVCKAYKADIPVLQSFSMRVEEGQIYGLLGSSGCGKSTVLSCIVGLHTWDSGTITVLGEDVRHGVSTQNIGYMPQDHALYNQLTSREMFQFYAKLYHICHTQLETQMKRIENLLKFDKYGSRRICNLSGGQKRRISIALAMLHDPKLLILDEPTVGLDPVLREKIWDYLFKLTTDQKTTIIITTHYIDEVKHAHMVGIMRRGTLVAEDNPRSLMQVHNTFLLEQVVLKLYKTDSLEREQTSAIVLSDFNDITIENDNAPGMKNFNISGICNKSVEDVLVNPFQRVCAYNQVVWINFLRQPIFIILLLVLPPIQILTTGFVLGSAPLNNPVGIVNKEVSIGRANCSDITHGFCNLAFLSCSLVNKINSSSYVKLIEFPKVEKARLAVERGNIQGFIEIPTNYSAKLIERAALGIYTENMTIDGTVVRLRLDMSDTILSYSVIKSVYGSFVKFVEELSAVCNLDLRQLEVPIFFRNPVYGSKNVTVTEYMLASLIICIMFEISFAASPLVLINDLNIRIFERSRVAGLKLWEIMCGISLAILTLTAFQAIICFISVEFILGFHFEGTIWAFILLCLVTTFCNSSFGLLIGIWSNYTVAIVLTAVFLFPVLAIHSGCFSVLEVVPQPFRSIIFYCIPNVSTSTSLRWIMSRGVSLNHPMVWPGVLVTVGWGLAFTIICAFFFRRM